MLWRHNCVCIAWYKTHIYICKCKCICKCIYIYILYIHVCMHACVRACVLTYVRTYVRTYIRRYVFMHACMCDIICMPLKFYSINWKRISICISALVPVTNYSVINTKLRFSIYISKSYSHILPWRTVFF